MVFLCLRDTDGSSLESMFEYRRFSDEYMNFSLLLPSNILLFSSYHWVFPAHNTPSLQLQFSLWGMHTVSQLSELSLFQEGRFNCRVSRFQRKCLDWEGSAILEKRGLLKNEWHKLPAFCWQGTQEEIRWLLLKYQYLITFIPQQVLNSLGIQLLALMHGQTNLQLPMRSMCM